MKLKNRYRGGKQTSNVKLLEQAVSLKTRLFRMLAIKRGARRLTQWLRYLLIAIPIVALLWYITDYALEKAYGLSIDHISYKSQHGIINKDQAMRILGVEGSVNVATLNTDSYKKRLEAQSAIRRATIRAELPNTLYIEVEERIPIVYVEMQHSTGTGDKKRFFMDPEGVVFEVQEDYHRMFMGVPIWYLQPEDVEELHEGVQIESSRTRPITDLVAAANTYDPEEIPPIIEIFRPKDWEIRLILETGTEVVMEVRHIREQMERLSVILDHARATGRAVRSANVIPVLNPVAVFAPPAPPKQEPTPPNNRKPTGSGKK